ncbi:MAG: tetratricopeptide repeat protein, partial [Myxococcota bacterium]
MNEWDKTTEFCSKRWTIRALGALLAVAILALAPGRGLAEPSSDSPSSDAVARANQLFQQGRADFDNGLIADALDKFEQALALRDHPLIRYNMGLCLRGMGRLVEAHAQLRAAVESDKLADELRRSGTTYVAELRQRIATLEVVCQEPEASVSLDGQPLMACPDQTTRTMKPGQHQLVAAKSLQLTTAQTVVLRPGKHHRVVMTLPRLERRWDRRLPWAIIGGGAALALGAVPLQLSARDSAADFRDQVNALCGNTGGCADGLPSSAQDSEQRSERDSTLAAIGFAVGGVALATGVVLLVLNQPRVVVPELDDGTEQPSAAGAASDRRGHRAARRPMRPTVTPIVGSDSAGVVA